MSIRLRGAAAGKVRGTEPVLEQGPTGRTEGRDAALGGVQKVGEKAVDIIGQAIGQGGGGGDQALAFAAEFAQTAVVIGHRRGQASAKFEQALGDAQEIQRIAGGLEVFAVVVGLPGIDLSDGEPLGPQRGDEVLGPSGDIFAAKEGVRGGEVPMVAGGLELGQELLQAAPGVFHRKGLFEDLALAVAKEHGVVAFGIVDGPAEDLAWVIDLCKEIAQFGLRSSIDRVSHHNNRFEFGAGH